jgi:hypothetical protein
VLDLGDHAAGLRRIRHVSDASDPIEAEPNQGLALPMVAAYRAAGLLNLDKTLAHVSLQQQHQFSAAAPAA